MKYVDGRGLNSTKTAERNKAMVKRWFTMNPNSTQSECASGLGLSTATVRKYMRVLSGNDGEE